MGSMSEDIKLEPEWASTVKPPIHYHEYQPDFDAEYAATKKFLEGKTYIKAPAPIRIIAIGGAASTLSFAREVQMGRIENAELVVYEKNAELAGTWFENRYPGCACDIPSHTYQYTWAPNPNWSSYYSGSAEIKEYFQKVAKKYDLEKYVQLRKKVTAAKWNEETAMWEVMIEDLETGKTFKDSGNFFINGGGIINNWKWPNIAGLDSFKGARMHSASWDPEYDFKGKKVVLIGNGSSGVQITPVLQRIVDKLTVVMRSPTWITAGFAPRFAGPDGANFKYSDEQKKKFRDDPKAYLEYRKAIEAELNVRFKFALKGSPDQRQARDFSANQMSKALQGKKELVEKLIPSFDVGCRRPTPGNGFLEALVEPNVSVSFGQPQRIVEKGLIAHDGQLVEADAIVCATGFDLSFKPRFSLVGREGKDLRDVWTPDAKAYMTHSVPGFPNYFVYLGPATAAAQGSIVPTIETLTKYIVKTINKVQRESYSSFDPLPECVEELYNKHQEYLAHTVWTSHCTSTFKNGTSDGRVNLIHGGSRLHHYDMLSEPRWEDFRWTRRREGMMGFKGPGEAGRYEYLGNGFSEWENDGRDICWYMDNGEAEAL